MSQTIAPQSCTDRPRRGGRVALLLALSLFVVGGDGAGVRSVWADSVPEVSTVAGTKRALLIGINNYKAVRHLMGSLNDVAAMQKVLITRWGFEPSNIRVLTEQAATRTAILQALREIVRESGPNDTVVVHFSGHGSQVQDLNGDEDDGLDETLVPWDGRTPGVPDIVDDELDAIFGQLRTRNVLIVLDSCHSGTATRGLDFQARGLPQDERIDLYRDSAVATRAIVERTESRFVVMSAVAADQEALDGPIDDEFHGVFTYALTRSLSASGPAATPREVFNRVGQEFARLQAQLGRVSLPDPQLEGPPALLDRTLLGGAQAASATPVARLAWLELRPAASGEVVLLQGMLLGAAPGSTWAIYPKGETSFAPGRALAIARVTGNVGLDAQATVQPAGVVLEAGARAVQLLPAPAGARIPIRIMDVPDSRRREIADLLRRTTTDVEIVGPERPARFLIDAQEDTLRLLAADGSQVVGTYDARTDQWATAVAHVVSRSAGAAELLSLDNPSAQLQVRAQVVGAGTTNPGTRNIVVVPDAHTAALHIRRSEEPRSPQNSLQLTITINADAYLTIVDVDSTGNANLLFPNSYQRGDFLPQGRVSASVPVFIPDSFAAGSRAGFFWDYGPPAGTDTIRIFASTDLATATLIRERVRALQSAPAGTRGLSDPPPPGPALEGLGRDLAGLATRGITLVQDNSSAAAPAPVQGPADWAAASLIVEVSQ